MEQADYFYANCKNYFGEGIPILDYEDGRRIGSDGAKRFLDCIYELTGVRCLFYTYRNVVQSPHDDEDWGVIAQNHALWVAQYANDEQTGYQDSPWLPGGDFGAWKTIVMHQYTSHGRLDGYGGNLDLDIAYMDADAWARYAKPGTCNVQPAASDGPSGSAADIAADVMRGKYGNGDERKCRALSIAPRQQAPMIWHPMCSTAFSATEIRAVQSLALVMTRCKPSLTARPTALTSTL